MFFPLVVGLALISASQQSRSTGEIKAWFLAQAVECNKNKPIPTEDMMKIKDYKIPDSEHVKCLLACVMRKANFINDKGNFDVENATAWANKEYHDDPKRLESTKNIYEVCKKVNDHQVSDGEKGCDRAYYLSKCLLKNVQKMGFQL